MQDLNIAQINKIIFEKREKVFSLAEFHSSLSLLLTSMASNPQNWIVAVDYFKKLVLESKKLVVTKNKSKCDKLRRVLLFWLFVINKLYPSTTRTNGFASTTKDKTADNQQNKKKDLKNEQKLLKLLLDSNIPRILLESLEQDHENAQSLLSKLKATVTAIDIRDYCSKNDLLLFNLDDSDAAAESTKPLATPAHDSIYPLAYMLLFRLTSVPAELITLPKTRVLQARLERWSRTFHGSARVDPKSRLDGKTVQREKGDAIRVDKFNALVASGGISTVVSAVRVLVDEINKLVVQVEADMQNGNAPNPASDRMNVVGDGHQETSVLLPASIPNYHPPNYTLHLHISANSDSGPPKPRMKYTLKEKEPMTRKQHATSLEKYLDSLKTYNKELKDYKKVVTRAVGLQPTVHDVGQTLGIVLDGIGEIEKGIEIIEKLVWDEIDSDSDSDSGQEWVEVEQGEREEFKSEPKAEAKEEKERVGDVAVTGGMKGVFGGYVTPRYFGDTSDDDNAKLPLDENSSEGNPGQDIPQEKTGSLFDIAPEVPWAPDLDHWSTIPGNKPTYAGLSKKSGLEYTHRFLGESSVNEGVVSDEIMDSLRRRTIIVKDTDRTKQGRESKECGAILRGGKGVCKRQDWGGECAVHGPKARGSKRIETWEAVQDDVARLVSGVTEAGPSNKKLKEGKVRERLGKRVRSIARRGGGQGETEMEKLVYRDRNAFRW